MTGRWKAWLDSWLSVHAASSEAAQRGRLLSFFISMTFLLILSIAVVDITRLLTGSLLVSSLRIVLDLQSLLLCVGLWGLNRIGRVLWAGHAYLAYLVFFTSLVFSPSGLERVMIVYAVPVVAASFIIRPVSSFVMAGLAAFCYSLVYLCSDLLEYNYVALLALAWLAFVAWLIASWLETALRQASQREEHYRALIETSPDSITVTDLKGVIIMANRHAAALHGAASAQELVGKNSFELLAPEDLPRAEENARKTLEVGRLADVAYSFIRKDGSYFPGELSVSVIVDAARKPYAFVAVVKDITQRKQAEEALVAERALLAQRVAERTAELSAANAELSRAARLKDEFLANMSHELRTPLHAILSLSEALHDQLFGPLNERQIKAARTIEESGRHLLSLINDILDLSKIGAGGLELQLEPVSVPQLVQDSLRLVKQAALEKQIQISSAIDEQVAIILADELRLKQILVNLLSNAVKFTPPRGKVGLEVAGDAERQAVQFTVWDTGIGIARQDMPRLFRPFVQLDSSPSRQYQGTGLGLLLVYRMSELHGGSVSVESQVGSGSRFTVWLPWRKVELDEESSEPHYTESQGVCSDIDFSPPQPTTVLLAEDNEGNLLAMSECLAAKGYQVIVARSGGEAIQRAKEDYPAIILMDIQLPGVDGLEAIHRIRADSAQEVSTVPIIALTALAMPGDCERCLAAGANAYMSKPVGPKELIKAIEAQREIKGG